MISPRSEGRQTRFATVHLSIVCPWTPLAPGSAYQLPFSGSQSSPQPLRVRSRHWVTWAWLLSSCKLWVLPKASDDSPLALGVSQKASRWEGTWWQRWENCYKSESRTEQRKFHINGEEVLRKREITNFLTVTVPTNSASRIAEIGIRHGKGEEAWNYKINLFCKRYHLLSTYYMSVRC